MGALTCSRSGLPAPTGDEVPEQAIRWALTRSAFQELGSALGLASPQPQSRDCTPRRESGSESWATAPERAAPPRAVSSPSRAPPGAARLACGGRDSQVEARRPARPTAAGACPVQRPPQGPPDEGRAALRAPGALEEGWGAGGGARARYTPPLPSGLAPNSIPTMSSLVIGLVLRAPGSGVAFAYIVHFRA